MDLLSKTSTSSYVLQNKFFFLEYSGPWLCSWEWKNQQASKHIDQSVCVCVFTIYIYSLYVNILITYMYMYHVHAWYLRKSGEGI